MEIIVTRKMYLCPQDVESFKNTDLRVWYGELPRDKRLDPMLLFSAFSVRLEELTPPVQHDDEYDVVPHKPADGVYCRTL